MMSLRCTVHERRLRVSCCHVHAALSCYRHVRQRTCIQVQSALCRSWQSPASFILPPNRVKSFPCAHPAHRPHAACFQRRRRRICVELRVAGDASVTRQGVCPHMRNADQWPHEAKAETRVRRPSPAPPPVLSSHPCLILIRMKKIAVAALLARVCPPPRCLPR